jgi:hypothetical protein
MFFCESGMFSFLDNFTDPVDFGSYEEACEAAASLDADVLEVSPRQIEHTRASQSFSAAASHLEEMICA